jgi:hypothetical protein
VLVRNNCDEYIQWLKNSAEEDDDEDEEDEEDEKIL